MNGPQLDRYITGNYGDDQLRPARKTSRAFRNGAKARSKGKPITSCPYRGWSEHRQEWMAGWCDEDTSLAPREP